MAKDEDQPLMNNGIPIFEWAPGFPIIDDDDITQNEPEHIEHVNEVHDTPDSDDEREDEVSAPPDDDGESDDEQLGNE